MMLIKKRSRDIFMKRFFLFLSVALLSTGAFAAADNVTAPKKIVWPFDGARGTVDRQSAQRGFKVYKEVCASCHSLRLLSLRNLQALGFSPEEVKAIAKEYTVEDGPDDTGGMFDRAGRPSDRFPSPYANEKEARASNGGAFPPDLSLMVKARPDGANYLYSLLTGYQDAPANVELPVGQYYNPYFPGKKIGMPAPLSDDLVSYPDNTPSTTDQMARDVTNFLQWAAEPEMEDRKSMGIKVLLYLVVFTVLFIFAKRRVWKDVK
jgi:ubiquinol-cytochrome c reductase cytochrome c1 subunit